MVAIHTSLRAYPAIGIDVGGVIIDRVDDDADTSFFSKNYLKTSATPGCFEAIAAISRAFEGRVHILSKCGETVDGKTRKWLRVQEFYAATGVREGNVHFCRTRPEKGPIAEALELTHFIDDRLDVLEHMTTVNERILFLGGNPSNATEIDLPAWATRTEDWPDTLAAIERSLAPVEG